MDETLSNNEALIARIQQLEKERDELQKDIEQMCMQNAGPSYIAVATRMHFERTAGLEQEIENLKRKLAICIREKCNFQEELSEAYRVKSQLADLYNAEVLKNMQAEKQVNFFHGQVAAAFGERDLAIMEAENAKEKEEAVSLKLCDLEGRIEELHLQCLKQAKLSSELQIDLEKQDNLNGTLKKVIDKFYKIRVSSPKVVEDVSWDDKCECLLHDSEDTWSYDDLGETAKYITSLAEKVEILTKSVDNYEKRLTMGLDIEKHLKRKVRRLEKTNNYLGEKMKREISVLRSYHSTCKVQITNLLEEGYSDLKSATDSIKKKMQQHEMNQELHVKASPADTEPNESEGQNLVVNADDVRELVTELNASDLQNMVSVRSGEISEPFSQALQEKVDALLLLSQQEERYMLESNVNATLQKKMEELHRNLTQATNEKVKALMELAQLKQENHLLKEKITDEKKGVKYVIGTGERRIGEAGNGKFKSFLKKTYLTHWIDPVDSSGKKSESHVDFTRMKIENAALRESLENMEHLIDSVRRLRLSLLKAREVVRKSHGIQSQKLEAQADIANIVTEAKLLKTALGISLPVSWSAEHSDDNEEIITVNKEDKVDIVTASGFEMLELLILACQTLEDDISATSSVV